MDESKIKPNLSILIPSIPSRLPRALGLYKKVMEMVGDRNIEVLLLADNKTRTIGEKRNALKNTSKGRYFMFLDDDDDITSLDSLYEVASRPGNVDVITFKQECRNDDGSTFIVTFGLGNEVEHNSENGRYIDLKRPPFHVCAWNESFRKFQFPDVSYGEDWGFVKLCLNYAETESHIDEVILKYNFNPDMTEASTEDNPVWDNPNTAGPREYKLAIVNLVTEKSVYIEGQKRLMESLTTDGEFTGDFFGFIGEETVGAPPHSENPYAFKIYAIEELKRKGYDIILWLDASIYAVKPIQPVIDFLIQKGIFLETAGHWTGSWCNQHTLDYFGITREEAMKMPMFSAGFIGFDFKNPISIKFFEEWKKSMEAGCFKGDWSNHRHDMTCGSIIANKQGLLKLYSQGGYFFSYVGPGFGQPNYSSVFHLAGL